MEEDNKIIESEDLLTEEDLEAISEGDHAYLNNVGAEYYSEGEYEKARIYYELASTLGSDIGSTNLGYIYMYGRSVPKDFSVALAFYKIGAKQGNIEALYKLGNLYQSGKGVEKDIDKAVKYYENALNIIENEEDINSLEYPSLYFTLAKEMMPNGILETDLKRAYEYLSLADEGYSIAIEEMGTNYYKNVAEETKKLLSNSLFDEFKEK